MKNVTKFLAVALIVAGSIACERTPEQTRPAVSETSATTVETPAPAVTETSTTTAEGTVDPAAGTIATETTATETTTETTATDTPAPTPQQ